MKTKIFIFVQSGPSYRSHFYLCLQVLPEPRIVDVVWEPWRVHGLDRVSILLGNLEEAVTLALNAEGVIVQLLPREMRQHVGQITWNLLIILIITHREHEYLPRQQAKSRMRVFCLLQSRSLLCSSRSPRKMG